MTTDESGVSGYPASGLKIRRFAENPIIHPGMGCGIGENINGPSLIRVPDWLRNPLGRYYLYFASHVGPYIRLACADNLAGPWKIFEPGTLRLEDSYCEAHIASPDMHVDDERRQIRMYYHGPSPHRQMTHAAVSDDGIHFDALPETLGDSYFRVFRWRDYWYALVMPGLFKRSSDGISGFEEGPKLFTDDMRHAAVKLDGSTLSVFYSNVGDSPEHIILSRIDLTPDWMEWKASDPTSVLRPETDYEGADLPLEPSVRGLARTRVRQLRDPAIYSEGDHTYLLYSTAGENGIAIAEIVG